MIKTYSNFIVESKYQDIEKEYHSIGEYIEKVSEDNDYLQGIVSNYLKDVDTDIRISNAVNTLSEFDKKQLFYRVFDYLNEGEEEKDVEIMTNVVLESESLQGGRNIFLSFLKSLTALGQKNITKIQQVPNEYLLFYKSNSINVDQLKSILYRFKSLSMFTNLIDYTNNDSSLYYGIKCDMTFEYGFYTDKILTIGRFKINRSSLNWLLLLQSPSANSLKKDIVSLSDKNLLLFCKIASEMKNFKINAQSKSGPSINGDVITFGYYGAGKWNNGVLDDQEYQLLRSNFKNWISGYKWSQNVLMSITSNSFWVYFNIKLKS